MTIMAMLYGIAIFYARPAYRGTTRVPQPDGTHVTIRLVGDEYLHYNTTDDGYSLVRRDDGAYVYAQLDDEGQLAPTALLAHDAGERTVAENSYVQSVGRLRPQMTEQMAQMQRQNRAQRARTLSNRSHAPQYDYSKFRGLVILVEFNDCSFRYDDYHDIMEEMINADDYTGNDRTNFYSGNYISFTGSIRDYFRDNSNGQFLPYFDVVGPVRINRSQYYPEGTKRGVQLAVDACAAADSLVNFKDYDVDGDGAVDMIYFIFAGLGSYIQGNDSRLLWPHQHDVRYERNVKKDGVYLGRYACSNELQGTKDWSVLEGIGTMCHEFSHVLGLPDFYDTNNQNREDCVHPDSWSVMSTGEDLNYGRTPCGYSLFERYALGFAQPQLISEADTLSLEPIHTSNTGYRLYTTVKKESFYLENRQREKWDAYLPGHGMLIFRVDSTNTSAWLGNTVNDNPKHPYYELIRAGGVRSTDYSVSIAAASDPFPGTRKVRAINNETTPNLKTWSGKPSFLGLRNIKETNGVITFETYNVNALTDITFTNDSYRLSVGSQVQLTAIPDPESAPCNLSFVSDNEAVATVDEEGLVTALSEGVAQIIVTANEAVSDTCTVTVTLLNEVPDIATFCAMNEGDDALLTLHDAQVLYVYDDDVYLRDATGTLLLSGTGLNVSKNDILSGDIFGRLTYINNMPAFTPSEGEMVVEDLTVTSGEAALPIELFAEELTPDHYAEMVLVKGMTLVRDGGVYAVVGDHRIRLWNKFQIKSPAISLPKTITGKYFDITAVYGTDVVGGEVIDEFYLLSSPVEGEEPVGIVEIKDESSMAGGQWDNDEVLYNLHGQKVGKGYHGIVVMSGKKIAVK